MEGIINLDGNMDFSLSDEDILDGFMNEDIFDYDYSYQRCLLICEWIRKKLKRIFSL